VGSGERGLNCAFPANEPNVENGTGESGVVRGQRGQGPEAEARQRMKRAKRVFSLLYLFSPPVSARFLGPLFT
jgi:hypothetical protein